MQRQVLYCAKRRKITVMENETHTDNTFEIRKCRVKATGADDLVNCLMEKASSCKYALPFGYGFFCRHPQKKEFAEYAKKLQSKSIFPSDVSQSDNQE